MIAPKVFTILNCGTAYDGSEKDVIAELNRDKLVKTPDHEWLMNPGPGTLAGAKRTDLARAFTAVRTSPLGAVPVVGVADAVDKGGRSCGKRGFRLGDGSRRRADPHDVEENPSRQNQYGRLEPRSDSQHSDSE